MILLGTGTSHGVPVIACDCKVCRSKDERDSRLRCSAYLTEPANVLIDVGPEFRIQALKYGIRNVDALLLTHSHADHLHGIDDLRVFSHSRAYDPYNPESDETDGPGLPVFSNAHVVDDIKFRFDYIFKCIPQGGGKPKINLVSADDFGPDNPIEIGSLEVVPVPLKHGFVDDSGWILKETKDGTPRSIVYLTDLSFIPDSSLELIKSFAGQVEHLVVDGLRLMSHSTHFSFEEALDLAEKLNPKNTYLTHITHNLFHFQIQEYVDAILNRYPNLAASKKAGGYVGPAFDGMELCC